jgi:putative ABC transport system substrate-binding protein
MAKANAKLGVISHPGKTMQRPHFMTLIGSAAAAWPLAARAQQAAMPVIGLLYGGSQGAFAYLLPAFRHGLRETGYIEGRNMAIEFRWGEDRCERVPPLAEDLVRRQVDVIVAIGGGGTVGDHGQSGDGDDPDRLHH